MDRLDQLVEMPVQPSLASMVLSLIWLELAELQVVLLKTNLAFDCYSMKCTLKHRL